jgi:hypothetical protein
MASCWLVGGWWLVKVKEVCYISDGGGRLYADIQGIGQRC